MAVTAWLIRPRTRRAVAVLTLKRCATADVGAPSGTSVNDAAVLERRCESPRYVGCSCKNWLSVRRRTKLCGPSLMSSEYSTSKRGPKVSHLGRKRWYQERHKALHSAVPLRRRRRAVLHKLVLRPAVAVPVTVAVEFAQLKAPETRHGCHVIMDELGAQTIGHKPLRAED